MCRLLLQDKRGSVSGSGTGSASVSGSVSNSNSISGAMSQNLAWEGANDEERREAAAAARPPKRPAPRSGTLDFEEFEEAPDLGALPPPPPRS